MTDQQREAVLTISLMAAFADGAKSDAERQEVRRVAAQLGGAGAAVDLPRALERVLLKQVTLPELVAALAEPAQRQLAYEMAVVMCDADGATNDAERAFLRELRAALGLAEEAADELRAEADAVMAAPLEAASAGAAVTPARAAPDEAAVDAMVLRYAILNGALELLPQNLATLAILPLQTKMVYRIGKQYGYQLDRRSIGEFLAVLGLGATSQVLENVARKLLGGLGRGLAGGLGKKAAQTVTGAAFSFGATWAIGRLAKVYYAGGRTLSAAELKARFAELVEQGRGLYQNHRTAVEQQAGSLKPSEVLALVRGA